jgi:glycosyltransferase involved in cell wall biosynthesis
MNNRKIKIVIGLNDLNMGGVQRLAVDQLKFLNREIFDLYLITLIQDEEKIDFYDEVPGDVKIIKLNFNNIKDLRGWRSLAKVLGEIKPDIVKSTLIFSNTIFSILKIFFNYVLITAEHNTKVNKTKLQIITNRILDRSAYTKVVDSKEVADFLSRTEGINKDRFTVIYNGVYLDKIKEAEREFFPLRKTIREEYDISESATVFLSVARLVKQKNHKLMIDSFNRFSEKFQNSYLVLIGDGSLRDEIESQILDLNLGTKILVLGERKDIYRFYAISDCYLVSSRHEGFCIVAMNSLAFGKPVISTKVAGISEYLKDGYNGFFSEDNAEDIKNRMIDFTDLSREDLLVMEKNGRNTASEYSVERYIEKTEKLFLSSLNL